MDQFVCIVTGANSLTGIGRASVYALAKKKVKVVYATDIFDEHLASLAEDVTKSTGVQCIPKRMDASSDDDIQDVISDALSKFGRLDVYYANAGVVYPNSLMAETKEAFLETMRINTWSVFAAIKYASEAMEKTSDEKLAGSGSIIATASVAGVRSGAGPVSYSASKAAVINICQSAAWRLRGKNIRVNAICPGLITTQMTSGPLAAVDKMNQLDATMERTSPLQRFGTPEEVAATAAFLASPEASFITGQDIKVDGGLTSSLPYIPLFADN